jgi:hypothetical protein
VDGGHGRTDVASRGHHHRQSTRSGLIKPTKGDES